MSRRRTLSSIIASVPAAVRSKLDQEIDFEHRDIRGQVIPQDLGRIADVMVDWQDIVADLLGLSVADRNDIAERNPDKPKLQRREALNKWKSGLGKAATYRALIEVFFNAGKADYADAVCDLFKNPDATSDLGVGSTTPTTVSHAQTTSAPTNTTAGHIGFSPSMGPDRLAQWLRQEYGSDYHEDVEKLCKAKISGKQLLNDDTVSKVISRLELSFGFEEEIKERAKQLKESGGVMLPSSSAANLPPAHTSPSSTMQTQPSATVLSHQSLYEQLKAHAAKWREIGTHLGFTQPEMNLIQSSPINYMEAPGSWLRAMLAEWLEWKPGDSRGSKEYATLEKLKSAVDKAGLGRTAAELHY